VSVAEKMRQYLGGQDNIVKLAPCITRIRAEVKDPSVVDEAGIKGLGAHGVVISGRIVQVVVGPGADDLAAEMTA
jgi:PTS system N-acetylglucosamine-specific IIB component